MSVEKPRLHFDHRGEEGQAIVEYALILALITVVAISALTAVGESVAALLDAVAAYLGAIAASL